MNAANNRNGEATTAPMAHKTPIAMPSRIRKRGLGLNLGFMSEFQRSF
jgi:hypothetical protein